MSLKETTTIGRRQSQSTYRELDKYAGFTRPAYIAFYTALWYGAFNSFDLRAICSYYFVIITQAIIKR
jgi:hypothetical protein